MSDGLALENGDFVAGALELEAVREASNGASDLRGVSQNMHIGELSLNFHAREYYLPRRLIEASSLCHGGEAGDE